MLELCKLQRLADRLGLMRVDESYKPTIMPSSFRCMPTLGLPMFGIPSLMLCSCVEAESNRELCSLKPFALRRSNCTQHAHTPLHHVLLRETPCADVSLQQLQLIFLGLPVLVALCVDMVDVQGSAN